MKKILCLFVICFLLLSFSGCNNKNLKTRRDFENLYLEALDGKIDFYLDNKKQNINLFLNELKENNKEIKISYALTKIKNNDNKFSYALVAYFEGNDGYYLIFTYNDILDRVIAKEEGYRSMTIIKNDMTVMGSSGTGNNVISEIRCDNNGAKLIVLANSDDNYIINGKDVTEEEYDKYIEEFEGKNDLKFIDYKSLK